MAFPKRPHEYVLPSIMSFTGERVSSPRFYGTRSHHPRGIWTPTQTDSRTPAAFSIDPPRPRALSKMVLISSREWPPTCLLKLTDTTSPRCQPPIPAVGILVSLKRSVRSSLHAPIARRFVARLEPVLYRLCREPTPRGTSTVYQHLLGNRERYLQSLIRPLAM